MTRISREQLIFRALAVLDENVEAAALGVVQPSIGLRFALMYLYAIGRGDRSDHDAFWRAVLDARPAPSEYIANYTRRTAAQTAMNAIARGVGVDLTADYTSEFRVARMPPKERQAYRDQQAALAEHRRRLREDGWQYQDQDRRKVDR